MNISRRKGRSVLWLAAALLFASGVVMGASIIPTTETYSSPDVKPGTLISVCWSSLVFAGAAAIIVGSIAACVRNLSLSSGMLLGTVMLLALLLSFGLSEAAFGFDSKGPTLQAVAALLHLCSAAYFAVALLMVIAVVLLPKSTHRTRSAAAN
jgi:hypothetical protein